VAKILMYLDKMDVDASWAFNHSLGLKVCEELRSISPWRLDKEVVQNFNSERKKEPEKKLDLKENLSRIAVNVQVTLDAEKKNDQASDSLEEEKEEEEEEEEEEKNGA
jgi:hypothetical protein